MYVVRRMKNEKILLYQMMYLGFSRQTLGLAGCGNSAQNSNYSMTEKQK